MHEHLVLRDNGGHHAALQRFARHVNVFQVAILVAVRLVLVRNRRKQKRAVRNGLGLHVHVAGLVERLLQVSVNDVARVVGQKLPVIPIGLNVVRCLKLVVDGRPRNPRRKCAPVLHDGRKVEVQVV